MAVSVFAFPDIIPSRSGFNIVPATQIEISKVSGHEYVSDFAGERWHVELHFNVLTRVEAMAIRSHLLKLRGSRNKSLLRDFSYQPRGSWGGTIRVKGTDNYGMYTDCDGSTPLVTTVYEGDRFKLGNRVHEVVDDATADANGNLTLNVANEIIDVPADNTILKWQPEQLTIACRWTKPTEIKQFAGNKSYFKNIRLSFIESLR